MTNAPHSLPEFYRDNYLPSFNVFLALQLPADLIKVLDHQQRTAGIQSESIRTWYEDYCEHKDEIDAWWQRVAALYGTETVDVDGVDA